MGRRMRDGRLGELRWLLECRGGGRGEGWGGGVSDPHANCDYSVDEFGCRKEGEGSGGLTDGLV